MLVRDRMTAPAITVDLKMSIYDALSLMKEKRIRRFPVVKGRRLVGIVTWTDLMRASPSPATSLTVWEIPYLLMKAPISEVMTRAVITVAPGATIEEAAVLMRRHKIGGLPVVEQGAVVGVVTESDIFDAFIDLMGLHRGGARLTIQLEDRIGALDEVVRTIRQCDVNIHSLAAYPVDGIGQVVVRVDTPYPLHLVQTLSEHGIRVTHLAPLPDAGSQEVGAA
jgi:acetoin utilization protein AcuB